MFLAALLLFQSPVALAWDSVAVFQRPDKVVVLINEPLAAGRRLENLIALTGGDRIQSEAEDTRIQCGVTHEGSGCTFRFTPSARNSFAHKSLETTRTYAELGLQTTPFDFSFFNSNGDSFQITGDGNQILIHAKKR